MKRVKYELFLANDKALQEKCKAEIKKKFRTELKTLIDIPDKNESTDSYKLVLKIVENEIWDTARKIAAIEGVMDVDPDLNETVDRTYQKLFLEEQKEPEQEQERPDPYWYHHNIRIEAALEYVRKEFEAGRGFFDPEKSVIPVAQFDTGYTNHPEIALINKKEGYNYIAGPLMRIIKSGWKRDARDRLRNLRPFLWASHGTSTASTIIGSNASDQSKIDGSLKDRVNGLLPNNVNLIPFRISENIISFDNKMIHAADQVIRNGNIKVITMSHASLFKKHSWKRAVEDAYNRGIIWIAASGSHAFGRLRSIIVFPAKFKETIATAASNVNDLPWERTHYGEEIDISAPGFDIYVPSSRRRWYGILPDKYTYKWSEGTSFATPITATAAALWIAHHGEKRLNEKYPEPWQRIESFRKVLKDSARAHKAEVPINKYGAGLLDILELLKIDLPNKENLAHASAKTNQLQMLENAEDKIKHITNKEIIYLTGCAKILDKDKSDETLFEYVYLNASNSARRVLDSITQQQNLPEATNPKSEAVKVYVKEFLYSWS